MKIAILLLLISIKNVCSLDDENPLVNIPQLGKTEGRLRKTVKERQFYAFEGVPYAKPPTGKHKFKESIPVKQWEGVWVANTIYKCIQYNQYTDPGKDFVVGEEDCLYLNIYTPNLDTNANLDVIVYIHGGAFMFNYGGYQGPEKLMDKDVVYVNFNYRLGPLGFLSTEDDEIPGNNGFKDQILALKWIKTHISNFGGNPNSVTINGMSAGGASVHLHYLTPKSDGLFHRGISQSGCALNPWVLMENALEKTKKLAAIVGCPTNSTRNLAKCLSKRPARQIVAAVREFQPWLYNPFSPFGIVVDHWASDPVFPDHPYNLLKNGLTKDLPWIISFTSSEGLYPASDFYYDHYLKDIDTRWNELMPFILDYNYTVHPKLQDQVSEEIRRFYLQDKKVTKETFMDFVKILSDRLFVYDIEKSARLQASTTKSPVFSYFFTYRGTHSKSELRTGTDKDFGASHADDVCYIYNIAFDTLTTENDRLINDFFLKLYETFARNGKPDVSIDWPALPKKTGPFTYLKIEEPKNISVESKENVGNPEFWSKLPIRENEKLFEVKDEL